MTTWQEDLQRATAAGFAAWGTMVQAMTTASYGLWAAVVDWAVDESVAAPPNAIAVPVHSDHATMLHARFHRADDDTEQVPVELVRCDPPALPGMAPGAANVVVVSLTPLDAAGHAVLDDAGYSGHLYDDQGQQLTTAPVYVSVHVP
ncbi:MAG TPA: hypothetical protein VJ804_05585 [Acidimicrobiales bacterium]|nr:hypothetical protein [Acidimicrobiales bacterium]